MTYLWLKYILISIYNVCYNSYAGIGILFQNSYKVGETQCQVILPKKEKPFITTK